MENFLTPSDCDFIFKKLEYKFKKSGNPLIEKITSNFPLTSEDIELILFKFEYKFKKSGHEIIGRLVEQVEGVYFPIKYSNIKAKRKRDDK